MFCMIVYDLCSDLHTKCCTFLPLLSFLYQSLRQRCQRVNQLQAMTQINELQYHPVGKTMR